jgi:alkaline phosphatase D
MDPHRRRILQLSAAAAQTLWIPRYARSQDRLTHDPFKLGVASGSPTAEGVVLWTRLLSDETVNAAGLAPAAITVHWEIADDDRFRRVVRQGQALALAELGHSIRVEVDGLEPNRWYHYRFSVGSGTGWTSPTGRTRTLPGTDAEVTSLRLIYASCQRWEHGHYAAWRHAVNDKPDLIVFLGDYIYEYPSALRAVRSHALGWALTLDDYRQRYALYRSDLHLQAAHQACPWFLIWDDHEVQNDYAGVTPGDAGPEVTDFSARRAAAYQAFFEHMPLRSSVLARALGGLASGADLRLHGHVRLGRLGSLTWLDTRQHKSPQACTRNGQRGSSTVNPQRCDAWRDPARTLLGRAQEAWLDGVLQRTPRQGWNLLAQTTVFGQRNFRTTPEQLFSNDGWDGYPPARQRLLNSLQRHQVNNPVVLGGDVHQNWVGHIKQDYTDPRSAHLGVELCGTSISSRSGSNAALAQRLADNPHFVFADAERRGYGLLDVQTHQIQASLRAVVDVTRHDSDVETLARFAVESGQAHILRV